MQTSSSLWRVVSVMLLSEEYINPPDHELWKSVLPAIPVIFSLHTDKWFIRLFPVEQEGTGSWDAEWAGILTIHCRPLSDVPLTRNCLKRSCQNTCFFPEHRILFACHSRIKSVCLLTCARLLNPNTTRSSPTLYNILEGGRWARSCLKTGHSRRLCAGSAGFMRPVRCFVCHYGEMRVRFCCSFQSRRGWLRFACCSDAEMIRWRVWLH